MSPIWLGLPCWKHLRPEAYRARVAELIHHIEATAVAERAKKGMEPLGMERILAQDPETRPETLDRSPAPFIHAATRKIRRELWEAYGWFVAAYREAAGLELWIISERCAASPVATIR